MSITNRLTRDPSTLYADHRPVFSNQVESVRLVVDHVIGCNCGLGQVGTQ